MAPKILDRDLAQAWHAQESVQNMWEIVCRDPPQYWQAHERAEKLVDIKDHVRRWLFNHVTTVEPVIEFTRGTGGTSGVAYLRRLLDIRLFAALRCLPTAL